MHVNYLFYIYIDLKVNSNYAYLLHRHVFPCTMICYKLLNIDEISNYEEIECNLAGKIADKFHIDPVYPVTDRKTVFY